MELIHIASGHAFELLGSVAIIASLLFTAFELKHVGKAQRVANLLAINRQHREIWSEVFRHPGLARVLDPKADVATQPVTMEEDLFVTFLILHLNVTFKASKQRMFVTPEGVQADIRELFSLPIPKAVWDKARQLQDGDFREFVEAALSSSSTR